MHEFSIQIILGLEDEMQEPCCEVDPDVESDMGRDDENAALSG